MFTVECPGCNAGYQVDERRVPPSGLRMRCPKCGTSFAVELPEDLEPAGALSGPTAVVPPGGDDRASVTAAPPVPRPVRSGAAVLPPRPAIPRAQKSTVLGVARPDNPPGGQQPPGSLGTEQVRPAPVAHPSVGGQPKAAGPGRPPPPRRGAASAVGRGKSDAAADLPAPVAAPPAASSAAGPDSDLPSVIAGGRPRRIRNDGSSALPANRIPNLGSGPDSHPSEPTDLQSANEAASRLHNVTDDASDLPELASDAPLPGPVVAPSAPASDLPSVGTSLLGRSSDLELDVDLPSPSPPVEPPADSATPGAVDADLEFELPSPRWDSAAVPKSDLDLTNASASRAAGIGELDLPDLGAALPDRGELTGPPANPVASLPESVVGKLGGAPTGKVNVPGDDSLPPALIGVSAAAGTSFDLPDLSDLVPPRPSTQPTVPSDGTASPKREPPERDAVGDLDAYGEIDLATSESAAPQPSERPPADPMATSEAGNLIRQSGGGTSFGEVNLETSDDSSPVADLQGTSRGAQASGDALEFGAIPQEVPASEGKGDASELGSGTAEAASSTGAVAARERPRPAATNRRSGHAGKIALGLGSLIVIGGAALSTLPDIGPFGAHFIIDRVRSGEYQRLVHSERQKVSSALASDDYSSVLHTLSALNAVHRDHERVRGLAALGAYLGYAAELRFGSDPKVHAAAKVILDELGERKDVPYLKLAHVAQAAAEGNLTLAMREIDELRRADPKDAELQVLAARIEMLRKRPAESLALWKSAEGLLASPSTAFGTAVAERAADHIAEAKVAAALTLQRSPDHMAARLLLAHIALENDNDFETAERLINEALARAKHGSPEELVQAKILLGDLNLARSRISTAEAAYQQALKQDPRAASALRGLGEALYRAGRFSESLARFQAGLEADPDNTTIAVGVAKAQLALERLREASALLTRLRQSKPANFDVNYWFARAQEALGNREDAEKAYTVAIEVGGTSPAVVDAYVALALLKNQQGRRDEAQKLLASAREKLPKSPKIHEALGHLALSEGRYDDAVGEFREALKIDPTDIGGRFRLGVALRRSRRFDEALECFDQVAKVDRDYPGLALERGLLYEASGKSEEALKAFEAALARAPSDPDLMLRVGCGKAAAGRTEDAEKLLRKVLQQRPSSAETHYCLGRALLLDGSNLALALRTLQRAVELDPHRAEYHLYVGWAANEAGRVSLAERELKRALELDQGLGDAYWQRGVLRYRQGAVKDAVADLSRALELRPGRVEAHAALADAYYDLGLEAKALAQWRQAVQAQPDNATWHFRYGKLLQVTHRDAEARTELSRALELSQSDPMAPRWAWEAHHLLARAIGSQPAAIKHWKAFLELSPRDNAYREEAKQALVRLGQPWDGD